jgi:hypothetical protein
MMEEQACCVSQQACTSTTSRMTTSLHKLLTVSTPSDRADDAHDQFEWVTHHVGKGFCDQSAGVREGCKTTKSKLTVFNLLLPNEIVVAPANNTKECDRSPNQSAWKSYKDQRGTVRSCVNHDYLPSTLQTRSAQCVCRLVLCALLVWEPSSVLHAFAGCKRTVKKREVCHSRVYFSVMP